MMRLDKFLTENEIGSRSQVKEYIKKGLIKVNGSTCKQADRKIDETKDIVAYGEQNIKYQKFMYFMLNKPQGVVTAIKDNVDKTVMDLLTVERRKDLFPVGRLDKDTEGLLLITNDGAIGHTLLSPKKHVFKRYYVRCSKAISESDKNRLETGVDIGDEKPTMPAKVTILGETELELEICEGRFHQVKRMLRAVNNEVIFLKRISFGSLLLDKCLLPGEYRELTEDEVTLLRKDAG